MQILSKRTMCAKFQLTSRSTAATVAKSDVKSVGLERLWHDRAGLILRGKLACRIGLGEDLGAEIKELAVLLSDALWSGSDFRSDQLRDYCRK